jgi:hypothetical protein
MQEVAQIRNYVCGLGGDGERGLGGVTDAWRAGLGYNCKMLSLYVAKKKIGNRELNKHTGQK